MAGEITLKAPSVVGHWISILINNIKKYARRKNIGIDSIAYREGRIIIESSNPNKLCAELKKVFGIQEAVVCCRVDNDIETISAIAIKLSKNWSGTFAVRTNRVYKDFPYTSLQVNSIVGERILRANKDLKVDLSNPQNLLFIEIRREGTYIYLDRIHGWGGLPYGVSGRGVALVSGGIDSTLAAWMMMKRGAKIIALHIDMSPFYSREAKSRFMEVINWLADWAPEGHIRAYIVPLGKIHSKLRLPDEKYRCIFCKMLMLKTAEFIANRERATFIITGEVLSQVASQTPENLVVIDSIASIPILRPLISMDKAEIDDMARRINVYNIVAKNVGKCKLVPKKPAVRTPASIEEKLKKIIEEIDLSKVIEDSTVL